MAFPAMAPAQWIEESYPLKAGWNAIWLSQDCSVGANDATRAIGDVLAGSPGIIEVWRWNPLGSTVQWTQAPDQPIKPDATWAVWRRGDPVNSTLGTLTGNAAYLVNVAPGTPAFTLRLTGKPLGPAYSFSSSGLNFIGFPAQSPDATTPRNFETFFSYSPVLKDAPGIFSYNGGPLSDIAPKNPLPVGSPRLTAVSRGRAYWVRSTAYSDYYGPLKVTVLGIGGVEFGRKTNTVTVRVKNVTDPLKNQSVTATFTLAPSLAAPGGSSPVEPVPLRARGPRDANLQFTYSPLPTTLDLAPGEEKDLVLDAHRALMNVPGQLYQSILQVTDSLQHTRIDLPVSATGSSPNGVWVGAAVLDSVNRVETISGPEFDAPLGTPDGEGPETREDVTTTDTTAGGQTTRVMTFDVSFDFNGDALLPAGGLPAGSITVSGPAGIPAYLAGADYAIDVSPRATVTHSGSGYSAPPDVAFAGGGGSGASAVAILSGGVRRVTIGKGGSGYTSPPAVEFTGGGGSGASGMAVIDPATGLVTDVTVTDPGSGYDSAPLVDFAGGGGSGAQAVAAITGGVGSVVITNGGSGYTAVPSVSFTVVAGDQTGGGAGAVVEVRGGEVAGVDVVHKLDGGGIGESARIAVTTQAVAAPGARVGTVTSTVSSISKLVTMNGKSHLSTRRVSTGQGAAAPSLFPVRLILHAPGSGPPTLLQQVYLGQRDGQAYAGPGEAVIAALVKSPGATPPGRIARVSSASFPRGEWWPGSGSFGSAAGFSIVLGHDAPSNPFVHTYHPDHDNWDARYESPLPAGVESYSVTREITLDFDAALPAGVSDLGWGVTTVGGTYSEVITGLRSEEVAVSGRFILHQVSEVPTLTNP